MPTAVPPGRAGTAVRTRHGLAAAGRLGTRTRRVEVNRPVLRRGALAAAVTTGVLVLLAGCNPYPSRRFDTVPQFAELQWRLLVLPLLLVGFAVLVGLVSLIAVLTTLRATVRGKRVSRWPLVVSSVLLGTLVIGGVVLLIVRLLGDNTITIAVAGFAG